MEKRKQAKLKEAGWHVGETDEFLELDSAESAYISMKVALAKHVRELRQGQEYTQTDLARQIHSSQSRVAKMEAGDPSVSLDLLVRTVLALGGTKAQIARLIRS